MLFCRHAVCHRVCQYLVQPPRLPCLAVDPECAYALPAKPPAHTGHRQFLFNGMNLGLVQPFTTGLHRVHERMWRYVSAGTGYWGPPNRLGVPAEITEIRLTRI